MPSSYTASLIGGIKKAEELDRKVEITYAITAHTDGTVTAISTDTDTKNGRTYTSYIRKMSLKVVEAFPTALGTAPDPADVTVKQNLLDLLGGYGVNLISATATKSTSPRIDGQPATYPINGALTIGIANQTTNAATFTIRLTFVS